MKWIIIALIILTVILFLIAYILIRLSFLRVTKQAPTADNWKTYEEVNQKGREFIQTKNPKEISVTSFDGLILKGLYVENTIKDKTIIFVHGYKAKDGLYDGGASAKFLYSTGYNLLFVDDRAHGKSQGKYIGFGVLDCKDVNVWVNKLIKEYNQKTIILYGISMGAATVLNASSIVDQNTVKGVVADCGFASGYDEVCYQIKQMYHLPSFPLVPIANFLMKIICNYSLDEKEAYKSIKQYKNHLLLIHGGKDHFVNTEDVYKIYENANCDKDLLVVDNASHALSYLKNSKEYEKHFLKLIEKVNEE